MRILLTFAVKAEFGPWSSRHAFVPYDFENWERARLFELFKANIGANEVSVLLTGMGRENTQAAMCSVPVETYDCCVSTGLAGAIDGGLELSEVVVAGTSKTLDGKVSCKGHGVLTECAIACGARRIETSITAEQIVASAGEKEKLRSAGNIVEMETTYILAAAAERGVPAIAVRAISDAADEDLPVDFTRILDTHGRLKFGGLIREVGLHPYRIAPLAKFGMQSRAAAKALADFLDRFVPAVAQRWSASRHGALQEVPAR